MKISRFLPFRRVAKNNKGTTAIEFALLAPIFFLVFMGIIEVGLTMFVDSTLNTALRLAARNGMTKGYSSIAEVRDYMKPYMAGIYREPPDMVLTIEVIPAPTRTPSGNLDLTSANNELQRLEDIATQLRNDAQKSTYFTTKDNFDSDLDQRGTIVVYAAKYKWGGFTGLVGAFLPSNLYAVTVVRNEEFVEP
ncbi:MAG: hypothetical protein COV36_07845 [Alphaproteobacteria bacterium CG11_big_fil_rev_8_21_14_0_20_44_7]|nr:MAG: hypothetical protein COV36_07845 [Alphaproteobacteria bacterium CG11_big_fil_rev_8_21_14_0_20_44_7]